MTEQEKMQQEALAMEALEEVSGGKLTKDDVKRYWSNTKKFVSDHKVGVGAAAVAITALAVEGGGRKFKDVKDFLRWLKPFLPDPEVAPEGDSEHHEEEHHEEEHHEEEHRDA